MYEPRPSKTQRICENMKKVGHETRTNNRPTFLVRSGGKVRLSLFVRRNLNCGLIILNLDDPSTYV